MNSIRRSLQQGFKNLNNKVNHFSKLTPTQKDTARKMAIAGKSCQKNTTKPINKSKQEPIRDEQYWNDIKFMLKCRAPLHRQS